MAATTPSKPAEPLKADTTKDQTAGVSPGQVGPGGEENLKAVPQEQETQDKETRKPEDAMAMLSADHRKVEELFANFETATSPADKAGIVQQICTELVVHAILEEKIFYPACGELIDSKMLKEAQVEHDCAKVLIVEIQGASPEDDYYDAKVKALSAQVKHHIQEEEKGATSIFSEVRKAGLKMDGLVSQMEARKLELMENSEALGTPETISFSRKVNVGDIKTGQHQSMARQSSNTVERDERGRFVSDDDDDRGSSRRSSSRSRDDDDNRRSSRSNTAPDRDERGRFVSDDDDDRGSSRRSSSRSRDDDDNRRSSRSDGRGWFGDSEGHSEAARRGARDDGRTTSRGRSRDDDDNDNRRSSRSNNERDRDDNGRFVRDDDDRGSSRRSSSRSRDDDDNRRSSRSDNERDRDERGRFVSDDDDDRGSPRRSSSRSRDDDHRGSSGSDGRGWYGDGEAHSDAARRGWQHRR